MVTLDAQDIRFIVSHIEQHGDVLGAIEAIFKDLDATYVMPNGMRPRQTISYVWQRADAEYRYLLNLLLDGDCDNETYTNIVNRYNQICAKNAEFEKENPPIWYEKKAKGKAKKIRVDKIESMFGDGTLKVGEKAVKAKPKKETVAERKSKLLNSKAVSFAFGFKTTKKDE